MIFFFGVFSSILKNGGGRQKKNRRARSAHHANSRRARILLVLYHGEPAPNQRMAPKGDAQNRCAFSKHSRGNAPRYRRPVSSWCVGALHMELVANNTSATIAADRGTFWRPTQRCYQRPTIFEMSIGGVSGHAVGALRWLIQLRRNSRPQVYANRQEGARAHATPAVFSHAAERPNFTAIFRLAAGHTQHPAPKCMR